MNLSDKMIDDIAGQLGLRGTPGFTPADVQRLEGKSDAELEQEILKMRQQLAIKGVPPSKQAALLRNLLPLMDAKQKARLQKVIELIER